MSAASTIEAVVSIIGVGMRALEAVAPSALSALTGGQSADEALAAAKRELANVPVRTGEDGAWEHDLQARKRGGEAP